METSIVPSPDDVERFYTYIYIYKLSGGLSFRGRRRDRRYGQCVMRSAPSIFKLSVYRLMTELQLEIVGRLHDKYGVGRRFRGYPIDLEVGRKLMPTTRTNIGSCVRAVIHARRRTTDTCCHPHANIQRHAQMYM